jgi:GNAT superfamily N-acetyltransferase
MILQEVPELSQGQIQQLHELWNREYPVQLFYKSYSDFEAYLHTLKQSRHWLYSNEDGRVVGWAFTFDRDGERWFAVLLDQIIQGRGHGRFIMNQLMAGESVLNGWVIDHDHYIKSNGKPFLSPLGFYEKCDFHILADQRLEMEILSAVKIRWTQV